MRLYRFLSIFRKGPSSPDDVCRVAYDVCRLMMYTLHSMSHMTFVTSLRLSRTSMTFFAL